MTAMASGYRIMSLPRCRISSLTTCLTIVGVGSAPGRPGSTGRGIRIRRSPAHKFEDGVKLTRSRQSAITDAEQKVEVLLRSAGGEEALEDFDVDEDDD